MWSMEGRRCDLKPSNKVHHDDGPSSQRWVPNVFSEMYIAILCERRPSNP